MSAGIRRVVGGDVSLIDLDQPADRATDGERHPLSRRQVTGVAIVALLIGAVFGGLVTHRWTVQQARATDGRKASVLVFAGQLAGSSVVDSIVNGDGTVQVTFNAAIAVVNAGPGPIAVQSLAARTAGLTVAGSAGSQWISPGTSLLVDVGVTANCVIHKVNIDTEVSIDGGVMQATVSVRTSSGSVATVSSLSFDTGPWVTRFQAAIDKCLQSQT